MQISEGPETEATVDTMRPKGRLLSLDLGSKRVGVAVSDELRVTVRALQPLDRRSWKDLLHRVRELVHQHQVKALIIGLPLRLDGSEGEAARQAEQTAGKFRRSISVPVYLQNESLTTFEAELHLKSSGSKLNEIARRADSEAAAIILRDFIVAQEK